MAEEGFRLYEEGDYEAAEPLLRTAIEQGDIRFLTNYASICTHNKWWSEEARVLMMGALFGDGDCYSYVNSVSESLVKNLTHECLEERAIELEKILKSQREEFS
jgi:hypothetical protein